MNILQLISGRGPTGAAAAAVSDARALLSSGARVFAATKMGVDPLPLARALDDAGVPPEDHTFQLKFPRGVAGLARMPRDVRRLKQHLAAQKIELLHAHRTEEQWLAAFALGSRTRTQLVRTWHRDPGETPRTLLKLLARNAAGFVCVARAHEQTLLNAGARRARFIHGAVDTDFFAPRTESAPRDKFVIGQSARWKFEHGADRGQRLALDIFAALPRELNWEGVLLGRGEDEDALRRRAFEELRLPPERVRIINTKDFSARDFAAQLGGFDLGMVSETGSDGGSRPALEMLSCGVPLMVAHRPGLLELAEDNAPILTAPAGANAAAWAAEISALLRDVPRLSAMRAAARERALRVHSFAARGTELLKFYRACAISSTP